MLLFSPVTAVSEFDHQSCLFVLSANAFFAERELERCPDDGSLLYLVATTRLVMDIPLGPGAIVAQKYRLLAEIKKRWCRTNLSEEQLNLQRVVELACYRPIASASREIMSGFGEKLPPGVASRTITWFVSTILVMPMVLRRTWFSNISMVAWSVIF